MSAREETSTANTLGIESPPQFLVIFGKKGIEVKAWGMETIPLAQVERSQHLILRKIQQSRQEASRRLVQSREAGWMTPNPHAQEVDHA